MSFAQVEELSREIKSHIQGVKVTFSEDLKRLSSETFTGWMQILPAIADKGRAIRYIAGTIAKHVNSANIETKKPIIHAIGDAAIDINKLAMGTGLRDRYRVNGYLLGKPTAYAASKLPAVLASQEKQAAKEISPTGRVSHLEIFEESLSGPKGIFTVVNRLE